MRSVLGEKMAITPRLEENRRNDNFGIALQEFSALELEATILSMSTWSAQRAGTEPLSKVWLLVARWTTAYPARPYDQGEHTSALSTKKPTEMQTSE
jgi:hypothetical protein